MSQDWRNLCFELIRTEEHGDKTAGRTGFHLKASGLKKLWPFCAISIQKMQKLLTVEPGFGFSSARRFCIWSSSNFDVSYEHLWSRMIKSSLVIDVLIRLQRTSQHSSSLAGQKHRQKPQLLIEHMPLKDRAFKSRMIYFSSSGAKGERHTKHLRNIALRFGTRNGFSRSQCSNDRNSWTTTMVDMAATCQILRRGLRQDTANV